MKKRGLIVMMDDDGLKGCACELGESSCEDCLWCHITDGGGDKGCDDV